MALVSMGQYVAVPQGVSTKRKLRTNLLAKDIQAYDFHNGIQAKNSSRVHGTLFKVL